MGHKDRSEQAYKPVLALTLGIVFVSTASILIRFAQADASSIVISAARLIVASLILVPLALLHFRDEFLTLEKTDFLKAGLAGLFLSLHFALWISSLQFTSVASSVVLVTTTPLWVAILSLLILKELIRTPVIIGLVISMVGGMIVGLGNGCQFSGGELLCKEGLWGRGDVWKFLSPVWRLDGCWLCAYWPATAQKPSTIPYTALVYGAAALILLMIVIFRRSQYFRIG